MSDQHLGEAFQISAMLGQINAAAQVGAQVGAAIEAALCESSALQVLRNQLRDIEGALLNEGAALENICIRAGVPMLGLGSEKPNDRHDAATAIGLLPEINEAIDKIRVAIGAIFEHRRRLERIA